ncbi:MAG: 30S ribosomal protein S27e [Candidatus Bilamarchaeaceae archaeon]
MSKFLKVKCKCGAEKRIFEYATARIKCDKCGEILAEPSGGKAVILGTIVESY